MSPEELSPELVPVQGALTAVAFRRSARAKRISLRIDPAAGGILITLPMRASRHAGLALLQAHEGWAAEKLAALPQALRFSPGRRCRCMGCRMSSAMCPVRAAEPGSRTAGFWWRASRSFWPAG